MAMLLWTAATTKVLELVANMTLQMMEVDPATQLVIQKPLAANQAKTTNTIAIERRKIGRNAEKNERVEETSKDLAIAVSDPAISHGVMHKNGKIKTDSKIGERVRQKRTSGKSANGGNDEEASTSGCVLKNNHKGRKTPRGIKRPKNGDNGGEKFSGKRVKTETPRSYNLRKRTWLVEFFYGFYPKVYCVFYPLIVSSQ